jgi:predicted Zn-dependent protease
MKPATPHVKKLALAAVLVGLSAGLATAQPAPAQNAGPALGGAAASLPSLGDNSELSAAAERRIGDRIAASIYRDPDYIDDPVLRDYVQGIWQPLMAAAIARGELHAELRERFAWEYFLIRDRSVNAFALPGAYFGIHLGLVSVASNRDELAAVLAHEISHVTQRHISRLLTQQTRQAPWVIGAMILGALAASKNPQAASAAMVGGQALALQTQLDFSRDMEREADRVGFGVMTDAGFEGRGVTGVFEKLQQAARLNDNGAFPYLRSHPLTTERIAEAQSRYQLSAKASSKTELATAAGAAEAVESTKAGIVHVMMAARARVLVEPGADALRALSAQAQRVAASAAGGSAASLDLRQAAALYAGTFAAAKLRDFGAARALTGQLRQRAAANPAAIRVLDLLALEVDLMAGKAPSQAEALKLTSASTRAELLIGGRALLAAGRAPEVSEHLQTWVSAHPRDAAAWQLLGLSYDAQGQNVRAIRADAEGRFAQLDYSAALDRFRAAQLMMRNNPGSGDFMEGSIIDARARQVESLVKEQALQDKLDR